MFLSLISSIFLCFFVTGDAFKFFQERIPNGNVVPHPCKPNYLWKGVGHLNADGGGRRNEFGLALKAAGLQWTTELCRADSDGDGRTNGEELGDPNCTWKQGQVPEVIKGITHPGVCEPYDSPACLAKNTWVKCEKETLDCPAFNQPDVRTMDITMKNVSIPLNDTFYMCNVVDLPTDRDYHMIGLIPLIDNEYVIHHSTLMGCSSKDGGKKFNDAPQECGMTGFGEGCGDLVGVWTLGSPGHCFHSDVGMLMGKNGMKRIIIQNHYTNPEARANWYDASGVRIYYTTKLRKYEGATWTIGQQKIEIPPGMRRMDVTGKCSRECTKGMNQTMNIVEGLMHAHYLANGIQVEHSRGGRNLGYVVNEVPYSYDNPIFHKMKQPVQFQAGDELRVTCSYQSLNRKTHTSWGLGTYDEMCYAIFFYYPKVPSPPICIPYREIDVCTGKFEGCDNNDFFTNSEKVMPMMNDVTDNCASNNCNRKCALALRKARLHPCNRGANLEYQKFGSEFSLPERRKFYELFESMRSCRLNELPHALPVVG